MLCKLPARVITCDVWHVFWHTHRLGVLCRLVCYKHCPLGTSSQCTFGKSAVAMGWEIWVFSLYILWWQQWRTARRGVWNWMTRVSFHVEYYFHVCFTLLVPTHRALFCVGRQQSLWGRDYLFSWGHVSSRMRCRFLMGRWPCNLLIGDREVLKVAKEETKTTNYRMGMFYPKMEFLPTEW